MEEPGSTDARALQEVTSFPATLYKTDVAAIAPSSKRILLAGKAPRGTLPKRTQ